MYPHDELSSFTTQIYVVTRIKFSTNASKYLFAAIVVESPLMRRSVEAEGNRCIIDFKAWPRYFDIEWYKVFHQTSFEV